jgi:hypothetical protein
MDDKAIQEVIDEARQAGIEINEEMVRAGALEVFMQVGACESAPPSPVVAGAVFVAMMSAAQGRGRKREAGCCSARHKVGSVQSEPVCSPLLLEIHGSDLERIDLAPGQVTLTSVRI